MESEIVAAAITAIVAWITFVVTKVLEEQRIARTSALALTSDIAAIMRVIAEAGIVQHFMLMFASPAKQFLWADVARKENYFEVFQAQLGNLGALRKQEMVADVTRFYTFLKASRDATAPLLGARRDVAGRSVSRQPAKIRGCGQTAEERHRLRMISVSVCEILETTFKAGIKVINTYKKLYGSRRREDIEADWRIAENTLKEIRSFLHFWRKNCGYYIQGGHSVLDDKINSDIFFYCLRMRYVDTDGLLRHAGVIQSSQAAGEDRD